MDYENLPVSSESLVSLLIFTLFLLLSFVFAVVLDSMIVNLLLLLCLILITEFSVSTFNSKK